MDELIDTEMGLVEVEQSDREFAAELLGGAAPDGLLAGKKDSLSLVRIIAKARIAEREACAKVVETEAPKAYWVAQCIRNRTP